MTSTALQLVAGDQELIPGCRGSIRIQPGLCEQLGVEDDRVAGEVPRDAPRLAVVLALEVVDVVVPLLGRDQVIDGDDRTGPGVLDRPHPAPEVLNVRAFLRRGGRLEGRDQRVGRLQDRFEGHVGIGLGVQGHGFVQPVLCTGGFLFAPPPDDELHWFGGGFSGRRFGRRRAAGREQQRQQDEKRQHSHGLTHGRFSSQLRDFSRMRSGASAGWYSLALATSFNAEGRPPLDSWTPLRRKP